MYIISDLHDSNVLTFSLGYYTLSRNCTLGIPYHRLHSTVFRLLKKNFFGSLLQNCHPSPNSMMDITVTHSFFDVSHTTVVDPRTLVSHCLKRNTVFPKGQCSRTVLIQSCAFGGHPVLKHFNYINNIKWPLCSVWFGSNTGAT